MPDFSCTVLKTSDYIRILENERKITFAVKVGDYEVHNQLSIDEFDTAEKIEARMAEIGAQIADEIGGKTSAPIPADILELVN